MATKSDLVSFDADLVGIIASKMEFVSQGGKFLYLRKGEASGAIEVATYSLRLMSDFIGSGISSETLAKIGLSAGAVIGGLAAINKAWDLGLKQLEALLRNLKRSREVYTKLTGLLTSQSVGKGAIPRDLRVICSRTSENEKALPLLRLIGARIRHRPSSVAAGTHRFHINEHGLVLHFRSNSERFIGVKGSDRRLSTRLKAEFLEEWERFGPDVEA